ncbi:unnamed protein product [Ectocarpus sp. 6 AP-2014]
MVVKAQAGLFLEDFDMVQRFLVQKLGWKHIRPNRRRAESWTKEDCVYICKDRLCLALARDREFLDMFARH